MGEGKYYKFEERYVVGTNGNEWSNISIEAKDKTRLEDIEKFDEVTLFFISGSSGTLTIQVSNPAGNRKDYDTVSVTGGELETYIVTGTIGRIGLKFDTGARVEAWLKGKIKKHYSG